jgi:hypothetical protein
VIERAAIEAYVSARPELVNAARWVPPEVACWDANGAICSKMPLDWLAIQKDGFRSFNNEAAGIQGHASQAVADNVRVVVLSLLSGRWTLAKIMDGATAFIRRGTLVHVEVLKSGNHTTVEFSHPLRGAALEASIPLEEPAVERALVRWKKQLADARVHVPPGLRDAHTN